MVTGVYNVCMFKKHEAKETLPWGTKPSLVLVNPSIYGTKKEKERKEKVMF